MQGKTLQLSVRLLVLLFVLCMVFLLIGRPAEAEAPVVTNEYVVSQGDTLWAIARDAAPSGSDTRNVVAEIQSLNSLGNANIHPGQVLLIPVG